MSCLGKQPDSEHLALESPFACAGSCMADYPSRVVVDSMAMRAARCLFAVQCLSGRLLGCVDTIDAFSPTCRESGQWLMHNTMHSRIKANGGRVGWLRRLMMGSNGGYWGYHARLCRLRSAEMEINVTLTLPRGSHTPIRPIMQRLSSKKSTHRQKSADDIGT